VTAGRAAPWVAGLLLGACGSQGSSENRGGSADGGDDVEIPDAVADSRVTGDTGTGDTAMPTPDASDGAAGEAGSTEGGGKDGGGDGSLSAACTGDTLTTNRNRLLDSYFQYLKADVTTPQTNGLSGSNVASSIDVWQKLDPSSQAVFLTLTARLQGSKLGTDLSSMLSHVVRIYRITGGQGATASNPGSCGGGEYNRMIMSMDSALQVAQLAANMHKGALQPSGRYDISDVVTTSYWRDSHDLGGPHSPFDISDETNGGAPRGQTQYFSDPTSTLASSPLGRQDLMTLVDPYALEMDEDYDCVHNSNPLCTYVTYGPACLPETAEMGTQVYTGSYGSFDPTWQPQGC
jgi:hypothetical protein